jgi:hypothetical protein
MAINNTLLQTIASDEMRGRVMSIFFLNRGLVPLGTVGAGFASEFIGVQATVTIMASIIIVIGIIALIFARPVREVA